LLKFFFSSIPEHIRYDWIKTVDKELSELKEVSENLNKEKHRKRYESLFKKYAELHEQRRKPKKEIRMATFNKIEREITVLHE